MNTATKRRLLGGLGIGLVFGFGLVACSGTTGGGGAPGELANFDEAKAKSVAQKGVANIHVTTPTPSTPSSLSESVNALSAPLDGFCTSGTADFTRTSTEVTLNYDNCIVGDITYNGTYSTKQTVSGSTITTLSDFDAFEMKNSNSGDQYYMDGSITIVEASGTTTISTSFDKYQYRFNDEYFEMQDSNLSAVQSGHNCTYEANEWFNTNYTGGWAHIQTVEEISGPCDACPTAGVMTIAGNQTIKVKFKPSDKIDIYLDGDLIVEDGDCH